MSRKVRATTDDSPPLPPALGGIASKAWPAFVFLVCCAMVLIVIGVVGAVIGSISSCTQSVFGTRPNLSAPLDKEGEHGALVSTDTAPRPSLSTTAVREWLRTTQLVPKENGWERVIMEGVHYSPGKYGCEFVTNCSLLGDSVIEIAPLDGQSTLSSAGNSLCNGWTHILNEKSSQLKKIHDDAHGKQKVKVQGVQLLYLLRHLGPYDPYKDAPLAFKWKLVEKNRPKNVVRSAFKKDFTPKEGHGESCDFAILPFHLPGSDGSPVRTQFDLSITFTSLLSKKAVWKANTPEPAQDLLELLPSVVKMVTVTDGAEEERVIFSSEVNTSTWRISSEEIRKLWLNPDQYASGKIVIATRQPLTVHVAYCVRGERW